MFRPLDVFMFEIYKFLNILIYLICLCPLDTRIKYNTDRHLVYCLHTFTYWLQKTDFGFPVYTY